VNFFFDLIFFVIVLGIAVTVHEWGHFIVARLCGVRVLRFSIGFGPGLVKWKWGETEYWIAPIPLGGYVKMAGESYEEELEGQPWEFLSTTPLRRIAIVLAGPVMNLALAAVIFFFLLYLVGKPYMATQEVGEVIPHTLAAEAGLQEGDSIVSVNRYPVTQWSDISVGLSDTFADGGTVHLEYLRSGQTREATIPLELVPSVLGDIELLKVPPVIDSVDLVGPARQTGLERGDLILSVSGESIDYWHELFNKVTEMKKETASGQIIPVSFPLTWQKPDGTVKTETIQPILVKTSGGVLPKIGISAANLGIIPNQPPIIGKVKARSPARNAGLAPGDRIVMIDEEPIRHAQQLEEILLRSYRYNSSGEAEGKLLDVTWVTPADLNRSAVIQPSIIMTQVPTALGMSSGLKIPLAEIGIQVRQDRLKYGLLEAVSGGISETGDWCLKFYDLFVQLFTGEASVKLLGGPIAIFQGSGSQGRWGAEELFRWIAILSANLAIINLLPIPILDGGHILLTFIEMIRRKRLSLQALEWTYRIAFFLFLLPLILMIFYVDIDRLGGFDWFFRLF
jgi:regulator of sigma E protease